MITVCYLCKYYQDKTSICTVDPDHFVHKCGCDICGRYDPDDDKVQKEYDARKRFAGLYEEEYEGEYDI